jgi:hypothetical protein
MSEMVQRVARAICASVDGRNPDHLIAVYEDRPCIGGGIMLPIHKRDWENYLVQARAAIDAMREPTEAMIEAGMDKTSWPICNGEVEHRWQAMIDEALHGQLESISASLEASS